MKVMLPFFSKIKLCEVHPEYPWAICVDRECIVTVWDFLRKERLMCKSMQELILAADRGGKASTAKASTHFAEDISFMSTRFNDQSIRTSDILEYSLNDDKSTVSKPKEYGDVKRIAFIDRCALQWTCFLPSSSSEYSFNTYSRIMIVCETVILFYDFSSKISNVLSAVELTKPPSTAEFISLDLCAIGCVDGNIR